MVVGYQRISVLFAGQFPANLLGLLPAAGHHIEFQQNHVGTPFRKPTILGIVVSVGQVRNGGQEVAFDKLAHLGIGSPGDFGIGQRVFEDLEVWQRDWTVEIVEQEGEKSHAAMQLGIELSPLLVAHRDIPDAIQCQHHAGEVFRVVVGRGAAFVRNGVTAGSGHVESDVASRPAALHLVGQHEGECQITPTGIEDVPRCKGVIGCGDDQCIGILLGFGKGRGVDLPVFDRLQFTSRAEQQGAKWEKQVFFHGSRV